MQRRAALYLGLIASTLCLQANAASEDKTLIYENRTRRYRVHTPPTYTAQQKYPCIILLHGAAANYKLMERVSRMSEVADKDQFIAVYPDGTGLLGTRGLSWNGGDCCGYAFKKKIDDTGFLCNLIDTLESNYSIDPDRVFLAGFSNGGMLAMAAAPQLASRVAALGVVAGSMSGKECKPASRLPILFFHGTKDSRVPINGGPGRYALFGIRVNEKPLSYAVQFWREVNHCSEPPHVIRNDNIVREDYRSPDKVGEVLVYRILGGGHAWPGGKRSGITGAKPTSAVNASAEMYRFFCQHPRVGSAQALSSVP